MTDAGQVSSVQIARRALLPSHTPLKAWIEVRMGQELEIMQDAKGQHIIGLPGELDPDELAATDTGRGKRKQHNSAQRKASRKKAAKRAGEAEASYFVGFGPNFWW
eukprot:gnl/TRDRNA2_/TRDRNA2_177880_c1_seq72.p1 gnl/TRDRNA2_/TRDRNA2_177880_c1~~gnl/TRDRNA2_/TRDRNA2_177880_c1_seq72.p1  ORF type:complete len:106 (-),score=22.21 gnl/TRDRNA2_/TRDRNA2_177880_c1_seq72:62-379(-)